MFKKNFYPHPRICLLILERGEGRERERERNIDRSPLMRTQTHSPGMFPARESNLEHFRFTG